MNNVNIFLSSMEGTRGIENLALAFSASTVAFLTIFTIAMIGFVVWWVILFIDLANREFEQKTVWIIIMVAGLLLGFVWLVDLLYFFIIVKPNIGKKNSS